MKTWQRGFTLIFMTLAFVGCSSENESNSKGNTAPLRVVGLDLQNPANEGPILIENKDERDLVGDPFEEEDSQEPQALLSWVPTGVRARETSLRCRKEKLTEIFQNIELSHRQQLDKVQEYFTTCEKELTSLSGGGWFNQIKATMIDYKMKDNPRIHEAVFTFNNGDKVRGHLAIKPSDTPRPLVIGRCGVFCDSGSSTGRMAMMHIFDESPFHFLWLGSTTGSDFINENGFVTIGGYYESLQHMRLLDYLDSPESPLFGKISSAHVFGLSLGANASLITSLVSQENSERFSSSIAYCPVVNLDTTLKTVFKNDIRGFIMRSKTWGAIKQAAKVSKSTLPAMPSMEGFPNLIKQIATSSYSLSARVPGWSMAPFLNFDFLSMEQIKEVNEFSLYTNQNRTPTLVWGSDDDPIVPQRVNSKPLREQSIESESIGTVVVNEGKHCASSSVYGWDTASALFRNYILNHSPEFTANSEIKKSSIRDIYLNERPWGNEYYFASEWEMKPDSDDLNLKIEVWSPSEGTSQFPCNDPNKSSDRCFRKINVKVPLEHLGINPLYVYRTGSKSEAQAITRWANTNLQLVDSSDNDVAFTKNPPEFVRWVEHE